jgi:transmembrane sensor
MTSVPEKEDSAILEEASLWCFRLADGDMSDAEQVHFDDWLAASDEHRRAFDDTVRAWRGLDEIGLQPDMLAFRSAALEDFGGANRSRWTERRPMVRPLMARPLMALAASLLLLIVSYGAYVHFQYTTYTTATGERRLVILEDGSRLSLDADSSVKVRLKRDRRELVLVRGRAKFDVAKDTMRPFMVTAGDRIVVATGTAFSVELLARKVHVILYEGRVNVLSAPTSTGAARGGRHAVETQLAPGKELVASIASDRAQVQSSDPNDTLSWEAGFLTFENETLESAVEQINRYTSEKLAVGDPGAASLRVDGVYPVNNPEAFVEGVTGVLPLRVENRGGIRTFVRRP